MPDDLSPAELRRVRKALRRAHAQGVELGRAEGRREAATLLEYAARLNGSTPHAVAVLKGWDESQHKRDHGKFSSTGGGSEEMPAAAETVAARAGGEPAGAALPHSTTESPAEHPADAKAKTLTARIREVPRAVRERVTSFVQRKYESLSAKYGPAGAKAVLAGMVALAPVPLPGTTLVPIALAEAVLAIRSAISGEVKKAFDESEARDADGKWTIGGGGGAAPRPGPPPASPPADHARALSLLEELNIGGYSPGKSKWLYRDYAVRRLRERGEDGDAILDALIASGHLRPIKMTGIDEATLQFDPKKAPRRDGDPLLPPNLKRNARGGLKAIPVSKIRFPQKWDEGIAPLSGNKDQPVIVYARDDGAYQLVDGFGRTSGLRNAKQKAAHAIVVTEADILENTKGDRAHPSDDAGWVARMYQKYAPGLEYRASTN